MKFTRKLNSTAEPNTEVQPLSLVPGRRLTTTPDPLPPLPTPPLPLLVCAERRLVCINRLTFFGAVVDGGMFVITNVEFDVRCEVKTDARPVPSCIPFPFWGARSSAEGEVALLGSDTESGLDGAGGDLGFVEPTHSISIGSADTES